MVTELRSLMHDTVASAPHDDIDLAAVLRTGRRRVRTRRIEAAGGLTLATAAALTVGALVWPDAEPADVASAGVPLPTGPVLRLDDASSAVEGDDYRVLASYTNEDLTSDNGEYFDGVTDDGLLLFREGQTMERPQERWALMDPATGEKQWIGAPSDASSQSWSSESWPVELGADRITLMQLEGDRRTRPVLSVYDRSTQTWRTINWPDLPAQEDLPRVQIGPDGRAYVSILTDPGDVPEGGWPVGSDGEADDADAEGDVKALWSMSLTDPDDVRDEQLQVGSFAFDDDRLVWTDTDGGAAGRVHVRDLSTGEESSFDPELGERCNLLEFGAADDRVAMSQYCGTYGDVRDDRVQVMTTDGDHVATVQGSGIEGALAAAGDVLTIRSGEPGRRGTYAYDLETDRFLRLSDAVSSWTTSGPTPDGQLLWNTPTNGDDGMTQHLGELLR